MCNFKSMIVTKDGSILHINGEDSHENIIDHFKNEHDLMDEDIEPKNLLFARVEITPPDNDVFEKDLKKWKFRIDQNITPTWFKKSLEKKCFEELENVLSEIIIDGQNIDLIENKNGLYIRNSEIKVIKNSQVGELWENSQVGELRENSKVGVLWGNSRIEVYSSNATYKLNDNALAMIRYKKDVEIECANKNIKLITLENK